MHVRPISSSSHFITVSPFQVWSDNHSGWTTNCISFTHIHTHSLQDKRIYRK